MLPRFRAFFLLATASLSIAACVHVEPRPLVTLPEGDALARASMNGKYADLLGTLDVPEDEAEYGSWRDYGWWRGRTYKGVSELPDGYWVYVAPTWYIWQTEVAARVAPAVGPDDGYVPAPELQAAPAQCLADEDHCCLPDGVLQIPGGCEPPAGVDVLPGVVRITGGWCQPVDCTQR